ncbi:5'-amp-activated protein kinase subunit gamma-2 [Plakobranchus ocellatus]|uniref:5'-amp-activated protein kinase subunit gamma-2 n=1 Tax=Plakobranchus ocellatus TaxID=259542 RepID=A0AAV3XZ96_9GAST|nr:5'-amp-activated protein kinase subunit gamma-2 [Plakobranchus ocellatus]
MCQCLRNLVRSCLVPDDVRPSKSEDLSAFAMPLIDPNAGDTSSMMNDSGDFGPAQRPRSGSGASALKRFLSSGSSNKSKGGGKTSEEKEAKEKKDKDKKKEGFFEAFRPRSKSDVSGLKRPVRKPAIPTEHSVDEATLSVASAVTPSAYHQRNYGGSQELSSPMGQILEGQMLQVDSDNRNRHKSGPGPLKVSPGPSKEGGSGFISKFRTRSNSDSRPKSPRRPLQFQKSLSPPNSPLADQSGLSPLKLQTGEPRSAPPGFPRNSMSNSDHTHAMLHRMSVDSDRMEIEDLDENEDQIYSKFMRAHRCYDLIPTSAKLVIFDTQLNVKKAFFALVYNGVRAAPLWDSAKQSYVGMLTITDFINILKRYYKSPDKRMDELEDHRIANWREVLMENEKPLVSIGPDASLFDAVKALVHSRVHRLPVIDENTGNAIYILTHKRILRFLHLYIKELPKPLFLGKSIGDLGIGTFKNVITATSETPLIEALNMFVEHRISALPVVDGSGQVNSIYAKFDVINLAADKSYNNLDITLGEAIRQRQGRDQVERVATCQMTDTVRSVMEKIVKAEVHRLVVIDECGAIEGIVSLSDLLNYIILRPILEAEENTSSTMSTEPAATS